jgi:2-amino-1-hydroxyethylphosphonate dioxygenase (glycine-forming)
MPSSQPASPSETATAICNLLTTHGQADYIGEPISQLAHSLQCAHLARQHAPTDGALIVAALLHDIGQFIPADEAAALLSSSSLSLSSSSSSSSASGAPPASAAAAVRAMQVGTASADGSDSGSVGRVGHERLGALYLARLGFPRKVAALVEAHVPAKRFLCATDAGYYGRLSEASKRSLEFQGGPMSGEQVEQWKKGEWWEQMCQLRRWDDEAKVVGLEVEGVESYWQLMVDCLEQQE